MSLLYVVTVSVKILIFPKSKGYFILWVLISIRQNKDLSNNFEVKIPGHGIQQNQVQQTLPCLQLADQEPVLE
jgi:hypothetical protein